MSRDREKYHERQSSAPCASIPFGVASINYNEKRQNMDPDFQLKVHFNAGGVQRVQKRFLNRPVLTKARLMTTLQKRIPIGGSHNIILDHVTNIFKSHVIRIEPPPIQIPNDRFTTLVILIVLLG